MEWQDTMRIDRTNVLMLAAIALFAVFLTVKYFPGLENEPNYAGNAFQTIHPEAFAGDPFRSPDKPIYKRPLQLSAYYLLIKAMGEIWLDDRFVTLFYVGLVIAGLLGIDRIARLLGLTHPAERLVLLMVFLKDHHILDNKTLLAHHPDVNHMAVAIPIMIWLTYAALARKGLITVLLFSLLLIAVSIRNGVFPPAYCLVLVAIHGGTRDRIVVAGLFLAGLVVAYVGLFHIYAMDDDLRLRLWDLIVRLEGAEANPFYVLTEDAVSVFFANVAWLGLCAAAFLVPAPANTAFRDVRLILAMALGLWLVGGLYISFAPDPIKLPLLIDLTPTRCLGLPQNLAYVAIIAGLFHWLRQRSSVPRLWLAAAAIAALVLLGPQSTLLWSGLLGAAAIAVLALHFLPPTRALAGHARDGGPVSWMVANPSQFFAQVLALAFAVAFAVAAWQNAGAWKTLAEHGVYGNARSAKWIGVAEYIRENTPPTASVLPYYLSKKGDRLQSNRSLATRSGRPMPVPDILSDLLNLDAWEFEARQKKRVRSIGTAFMAGDLATAAAGIARLVPIPDYIVLPTVVIGKPDEPAFPYAALTTIRDYTLLRRRKDGSNP